MQYGKVEICGVDTARLKLLSEDKKRKLLHIIKNGTPAERKRARDEMINGNLRLVLSVIQRFNGRGENPDDLFQVGVIGLMKAIDQIGRERFIRLRIGLDGRKAPGAQIEGQPPGGRSPD